jgi:hypothetical protein
MSGKMLNNEVHEGLILDWVDSFFFFHEKITQFYRNINHFTISDLIPFKR